MWFAVAGSSDPATVLSGGSSDPATVLSGGSSDPATVLSGGSSDPATVLSGGSSDPATVLSGGSSDPRDVTWRDVRTDPTPGGPPAGHLASGGRRAVGRPPARQRDTASTWPWCARLWPHTARPERFPSAWSTFRSPITRRLAGGSIQPAGASTRRCWWCSSKRRARRGWSSPGAPRRCGPTGVR